jgi:4-hydroxy-4-methyl-2-oxoglutarate aldolase
MLDKLRQFDTPTICNVIELFDVRPRSAGYMDKTIQAAFPEMPPMVGYAATITCRTVVTPQGDSAYTQLTDQVRRFAELDGPAVVVFQDLDVPDAAATFGEIMCTTYQAFGAVGLVTNAPGRDLDQVRAINFPVFTDGAVCSHGYIQMLDLHVPVRVGGITVYPNDLLHGDCNGVTTIPADIAAEVADAGDEYVAAEQVIMDAMRSGAPTVALLEDAMREKDVRVARLKARLGR